MRLDLAWRAQTLHASAHDLHCPMLPAMNRILLVEDHAAMRELVLRELQQAGIAVDAVGRVSEAEACLAHDGACRVRVLVLKPEALAPDAEAAGVELILERQVT